jgi:hypothetical protein
MYLLDTGVHEYQMGKDGNPMDMSLFKIGPSSFSF